MKKRESWLRFAGTGLAVVLVLSLSVMAAGSSPSANVALDPAAPAGADDGYLDVGAEFPSADAPPWGASTEDRPIHRDSAWNFYNEMRDAGYTGSHSFIWGNNAAWETDWKRAALGGSEDSWVDNVDIMFVHSHGGTGSIWIPWGHTDDSVVPNDCLMSWGTKDVEWIGIKTCLTLGDAVGWASCMNGVHLIAGFTTLSASNEFGGYWADQLLGWYLWPFGWLRQPKTVTQAWFTTCDARTAGARARVLAEEPGHFNDKVWNRGGPALGDVAGAWPRYFIDHNCYKPAPKAVDVSILAEMPAYQVLPRNVTKAFAESLAATLGVQGELALSPDGQEYAVTTADFARTLSIQTATGGYQYQDASQLWVPPAGPLTLPDPATAATLAGAYFLANASALPGGHNFDTATPYVEQDKLTTLDSAAAAAGAAPTVETGVDVMVAYGRTLAATATTPSGDTVIVDTSVAGPGSATKMYLGGQSTAPIGLSGGSRDVAAAGTVILKDVDATWPAFLDDPGLSVLEIAVDYDEIVRKSNTFAYFEQPLDVSQKELIPTWVYTVDFKKGGQLVAADGKIYVPASADYYPPGVTIDKPVADETIVAGTRIALNATLTPGNGPFTYEWSSSSQGVLGTAEDINVMLANKGKAGDPPEPVTLSLKVTDANGLLRMAQVKVNVVGQPVWLPILLK